MEIFRVDDHIHAIDHDLLARPGVGVTYVVRGDDIALIETGTSLTVPATLAGLQELSILPEQVGHIICTHVHMDHAGGAGYLADALPRAQVHIHSMSIEHLVDPSRLIPSVRRAVGEAAWPLHGDILPIPAERLSPSENLHLDLGQDVVLEGWYTPGHSPDHVAYWDRKTGGLFAGDSTSLFMERYNLLLPITPVPTYNLAAHRNTFAMLRQADISRLYITHYGPHDNVADVLRIGEEKLDELVEIVNSALNRGDEDVPAINARWVPYAEDHPGYLIAQSWGEMSVAGMLRYEKKRRQQ
ncbi:MAG: MBL fold metallo-hydrolase [Chloroflexaceae bacterium]|nr:MBL fold metallo-hydrolase [Chloroflexaceae bacterium]